MTLVQSWIDSLTLLKPKNAQLFIMVTIKSIIEAYKTLAYYFFVLVLMLGVWIVSLFDIQESSSGIVALSLYYQLLLFATCAATRPSIMKKDRAYFKSQNYVLIYVAIILFFIPKLFWPTAHSPFYIFLILFFLDSAKGPKNFLFSAWNALKMILYNLPLLAIVGCFFYLIGRLFFKLMLIVIASVVSDEVMLPESLWAGLLLYNILAALLVPIGVCTYANIYIKKLHDQFDLYFQSP